MNATGTDQSRVSRVLVERYLERVRKRRRWRRLSVTVTVFLALLALGGYSLVWHTKVFDVRSTTVSGVKVLSRQQVLAVAAVPAHAPVAGVDTKAVKARLLTVPRIKNAWVERSLPHTVSITVVERVAAAALPNADGSFVIVDGEGVAFDTVATAGAIPAHVPVIHLEQFVSARPKDRAVTVSGALAALGALPATVRSRVLTVSATGPYAITLTLAPSTAKQQAVTVVWGGPEHPDLKARILTALIGRGDQRYDVSAPDAPAYSR